MAILARTADERVAAVKFTKETISVTLKDGRTITVPLAWYPRLAHGNSAERNNWRLIGGGRGIHWPEIDEDISIANLLAGQPSCESLASFKKWLEKRTKTSTAKRR